MKIRVMSFRAEYTGDFVFYAEEYRKGWFFSRWREVPNTRSDSRHKTLEHTKYQLRARPPATYYHIGEESADAHE